MARGPALSRRTGVWRQLDVAARQAFPGFMLLLGLFLIGIPLGLPGQAALRPAYMLSCVFFWTLYRPGALPLPFTAFAGLLTDLAGLTPLGLWAVLLLVLQFVTTLLRPHLAAARFTRVWAVFAGMAACACALEWIAGSVLALRAMPVGPAFAEIALACALYPALAALLIRAHRSAAAAEHV